MGSAFFVKKNKKVPERYFHNRKLPFYGYPPPYYGYSLFTTANKRQYGLRFLFC
jgi:hypothetical protein